MQYNTTPETPNPITADTYRRIAANLPISRQEFDGLSVMMQSIAIVEPGIEGLSLMKKEDAVKAMSELSRIKFNERS